MPNNPILRFGGAIGIWHTRARRWANPLAPTHTHNGKSLGLNDSKCMHVHANHADRAEALH